MKKITGIYQIQSKLKPEKLYIGSAVYISLRWNRHLSHLRLNNHPNKKLQNHFNKYGEVDLQFSILLGCPKEDLIKIEQYFIDSYNPYFNICKIAGSCLGIKRSEETLMKMRKNNKPPSHKGKHRSEETLKNMRESHVGFKKGCIPWNKEFSGYSTSKKGKHYIKQTA